MKRCMMALLAMTAMLVAGCGEKKCFFVTQDGNGLAVGAPVVWYDAYVGRVEALEEVADGTKVSFCLDKKFGEEIRDGVAGRVVNDLKISPRAFVLLVGGRDGDRSLVSDGSQIPESKATGILAEGFSAFMKWLKESRSDELIVTAVVVLVLFVLLKFVGKILKFVFFVCIILTIVYFCVTANIDWGKHKQSVAHVKEKAMEAKDWLQQNGERLQKIFEVAPTAK